LNEVLDQVLDVIWTASGARHVECVPLVVIARWAYASSSDDSVERS
jgi:hypothetical protein